jgi:hypothetical protein
MKESPIGGKNNVKAGNEIYNTCTNLEGSG